MRVCIIINKKKKILSPQFTYNNQTCKIDIHNISLPARISKISLWETKNCVVIDLQEILASISNMRGLLPMRTAKPPSLSRTGIGGGGFSTTAFSAGLGTGSFVYANIKE